MVVCEIRRVVSGANTLIRTDHTKLKGQETRRENGVGNCVYFCLRLLLPLERCETKLLDVRMEIGNREVSPE